MVTFDLPCLYLPQSIRCSLLTVKPAPDSFWTLNLVKSFSVFVLFLLMMEKQHMVKENGQGRGMKSRWMMG